MTISQLNSNEYYSYYQVYIDKVPDVSLVSGLSTNGESFYNFLESIPEEKYDYAYADGKWTIKKLVQHIIDTERVFTYRALNFARNDKNELPGYDQDQFAMNCDSDKRSKQSLIHEYKVLRQTTVALFENLSDDALVRIGKASGYDISVRALGFILIGHENHHREIMQERYL